MITTNSLGQRIAKTDKQIRAFWRWFGDSKVVDEQGRPSVVYHGTGAKFDAYNTKAVEGRGFYFFKRRDAAEMYANGASARVVEAYIKLRQPATEAEFYRLGREEGLSKKEAVARLRANGNDGIDGPRAVVAFSPTQIKSATSNRGTFDPKDPVITNPPLGNTGLEFQQNAARKLLVLALRHEGLNVDAADDLIAEAFSFAKRHWQIHHNRILPVREYPALRLESTLRLAQAVASGLLRP